VGQKDCWKYTNYPVDKWNNLFKEVANKLKEIGEGAKTDVADMEARDQQQNKLASSAPNLDFHVEAKKITIDYQNLKSCTISYFKMDVELLFSTSPFVQQNLGHFSYIMPNQQQVIELDPTKDSKTIELPKELHNTNIMIDVQGAGVQKSEAYFSNGLFVSVIENYGQLKVNSKATGKPCPKVYVKAYANRNDGSVCFYKDGYTDLTGRFDFTSLMTSDLDNVQRFSILVMSPEEGSAIKEAAPPKV